MSYEVLQQLTSFHRLLALVLGQAQVADRLDLRAASHAGLYHLVPVIAE